MLHGHFINNSVDCDDDDCGNHNHDDKSKQLKSIGHDVDIETFFYRNVDMPNEGKKTDN